MPLRHLVPACLLATGVAHAGPVSLPAWVPQALAEAHCPGTAKQALRLWRDQIIGRIGGQPVTLRLREVAGRVEIRGPRVDLDYRDGRLTGTLAGARLDLRTDGRSVRGEARGWHCAGSAGALACQ